MCFLVIHKTLLPSSVYTEQQTSPNTLLSKNRTIINMAVTERHVVPLETFAVVDVRPGNNKVMMRGTGLRVTETEQLVILQNETERPSDP